MKTIVNYFKICIMIYFIVCGSNLTAQSEFSQCGTAEVTEKEMNKILEDLEKSGYSTISASNNRSSGDCPNPIRLPMAFHFSGGVDDSDLSCIKKAIDAQLKELNEVFAGQHQGVQDYKDLANRCSGYPENIIGENTCIEFAVANKNHPDSSIPDGDYAMTINQYSIDNKEEAATKWDGYFNVFISEDVIVSGNQVNGAANINGINWDVYSITGAPRFAVRADKFGAGISCGSGVQFSSRESTTFIHEVGHYLGLHHCWNSSVADIPCQTGPNFFCPEIDENCNVIYTKSIDGITTYQEPFPSCCDTETNPNCDGVSPELFFNFMDYGSCRTMFTAGQVERMRLIAGYANSRMRFDDKVSCSIGSLGLNTIHVTETSATITVNPSITNTCNESIEISGIVNGSQPLNTTDPIQFTIDLGNLLSTAQIIIESEGCSKTFDICMKSI